MTRKTRLKKGDKVVVISGAWKTDEPAEILRVHADSGKVVVEGVNLRWKHERRSQQNPDGGRTRTEFPIDASNVLLYSEKAGKGVRIRREVVDGKRARVGTCGTRFD